jgi:hypothetical protein
MMPTPTSTNPRRVVFAFTLAICGTANALALGWILLRHPNLNADFLGFWAYPRFTQILSIYNPDAMMHFQQALYPGYKSFFPFTYPPDFLLFCGWLHLLGYNAARDVWLLAGLSVFTLAGRALFPGRPLPVLALLASPAALLCIVEGQSSFFMGALLLGGLAALPRRPVLAGVLFGLLTLKPQLGLLLPVLLLTRGEWRAIAAAILTAGFLVALSCLVLPPALWHLWSSSLPQIQRDYFSGGTNLNIMITPAANLSYLGAPPRFAMGAQAMCTLAAAALTWHTAKYRPYEIAIAVLLAASFLAQPHAYAYDLVTLPAALVLGLSNRPFWAQALGFALYLGPLLLLSPFSHGFLYAGPLAVLLVALAIMPLKGADSGGDPIPLRRTA